MNKILTFSIAAYNAEKTIRETLESLVCDSLTMDSIEALIVDDGSTDSTAKIAEEYVKKYPNTFKYVSKVNEGHGSTLNYSMCHAKGKYLRMLDADDLVNTNELARYVEDLKAQDADCVVTPFINFNDGDDNEEYVSRHNLNDYKIYSITDTCTPIAHEFAIKTEKICEYGGKILEHCSYVDTEFSFYASMSSETIVKLPEVIYRYRHGRDGQTVSDTGRLKHFFDGQKVIFHLLDEINENWINLDLSKRSLLYESCDYVLDIQTYAIIQLPYYQKNERLNKYMEFIKSICDKNKEYMEGLSQRNHWYGLRNVCLNLPTNGKYVVWGSGIYGKRVIDVMLSVFDSELYIVDGNSELWDTYVFDIKVYSPDIIIEKLGNDAKYIIAMKNNVDLVREEIKSKGIRDDMIYGYNGNCF